MRSALSFSPYIRENLKFLSILAPSLFCLLAARYSRHEKSRRLRHWSSRTATARLAIMTAGWPMPPFYNATIGAASRDEFASRGCCRRRCSALRLGRDAQVILSPSTGRLTWRMPHERRALRHAHELPSPREEAMLACPLISQVSSVLIVLYRRTARDLGRDC